MANLDVSLDDLIKKNKTGAGRGKGGNRGGGKQINPYEGGGRSGPVRRGKNRATLRSAPYSRQGPAYVPARPTAGIQTGFKLHISNLDFNVSNEDIKELFGELGDLKRSEINFDKSGRSLGTAEVVFSRKQDAKKAIAKYHNVVLDGKPMRVEEVKPTLTSAPAARTKAAEVAIAPQGRGLPVRGRGVYVARGGKNPRGRGVGRGAATRGRGGRGGKPQDNRDPAEIQKELDAELEKYHQQTTETMAE